MTNASPEDMHDAYQAANELLKAEMEKNPLLKTQFHTLKEIHPIIVPGTYDHIEKIFDVMQIPYDTIFFENIPGLKSLGNKPIYINCASRQNSSKINKKLEEYVQEGGTLVTTDWNLPLIQSIFPRYVQWQGQQTGPNESFPIDQKSEDKDAPTISWFIENGSYPITIINQKTVKTILKSTEFGNKYNCNPSLGIAFEFGKGIVIHYVSHLYSQFPALRKDIDKQASVVWAQKQGIDLGNFGAKSTVAGVSCAFDTMATILRTGTINTSGIGTTCRPSTIMPEIQTPLKSNQAFYLCSEPGTRKIEQLIADLAHEYIIGRCPETNLQIFDTLVSRRHACLYSQGEEAYIKDLQSQNGTYVNQTKIITPLQLYYGDVIQIGNTKVKITPLEQLI